MAIQMNVKRTLDLSFAKKCEKLNFVVIRTLQTSSERRGRDPFYVDQHKRVTKFTIPNRDSQWDPKHIPKHLFDDYFNYPIYKCPLGMKHPGFWFRDKFHYVKEMEPELIVPDLTDFKLKPYVSYRTPDVEQSEYNAKALFNKTYANTIVDEFLKGEKIEMKASEKDIRAARIKAKQTGADLFEPTIDELIENDKK
ncbi:39S ribosomal protein L41-like protein [Dinothrombium tinctorium]|uniref:39S ribosomal protein L41-like protein n=1 Tax=Dinothrombium tinctorium TaxID=1965070 RepID=A0A3S3RE65_9ACAR|nr:39S ribosomal protein L41-like protein [Dinothrombium tinctorium]RWR99428.1 39S ribosomal protein L41-like protein [Dinothrombium tinctorium]RWR99431.1 39S ribosomal protein L41-like protein [Dinothrombium tinctorium]RWS00448.1 39S ribosomal protein L41-like protein [Dinothrombium tinctorium]